MEKLIHVVNSLTTTDNKRAQLDFNSLGLVNCSQEVYIKNVPFYTPCLIIILEGRKVIYTDNDTRVIQQGSAFTVPGPNYFNISNHPNKKKKFTALLIPFEHHHLEQLHKLYQGEIKAKTASPKIIRYEPNTLLLDAVSHYLQSPDNSIVTTHRLLEVLLILAEVNPCLFSYMNNLALWSNKVRAILGTDLSKSWSITQVCQRLFVSESTLRRRLTQEGAGFRTLLHEVRLSTALMQLLQTKDSISSIAFQCGYQTVSRFSQNFHQHFGLPPTKFRTSVTEKGQPLEV